MTSRNRFRLPIYLFPIVFGLCGFLVAAQIVDNPALKNFVLLVSICVPLFTVGMLVAQLNVSGIQRVALITGVVLLALGAFASISRIGIESFSEPSIPIPRSTELIGRWLGISSLIVGLFAIVYILSRREEQIEVIGDRFRYLADHISEGFILVGADGTIALVNDALLKMTNLTADQLIGKRGRDLAEQYQLETMLSHMKQRNLGIASQYRLVWNRGGEELQLWINGTPLFDSRGQFAGTLATVRDVTEQHKMSMRLERYAQGLQELVENRTEQLHESRQRLRDILLHMNEAFVTVDREYRITFANERFCEMLEVTPDAVLKRDLFEFVESSDRGRLLELFSRPKAGASPHPQQELTLRGQGGEQLHIVASASPIEPAPGVEDRHSLVMTDIGEIKRMQHQLEVRATELEELNTELRMLDRAKDNFLSTVSHELRTPLSTVRGYTEMLEGGTLGELQPQQSNALKVMSRNLERLGGLIDEIIEFSRMEVRGLLLHQTLFSSERLLMECAASIEPQARVRDLHVRVQASPDCAILWGDRRRLLQAIAILLANAVKFCNPGDVITLSSDRRAGGVIALGVSDTGIGIDPSVQRRVFDKFYQADNSLSRRYEGAGIGLAIAKAITEAHGGHIGLQSTPGKGSTFTLLLNQARFLSADPDIVPRIDSDQTVLLAVPEPDFGTALRGILEAMGLRVAIVPTGMACIRSIKAAPPALLIIDDVLPDLGGAATIARLREEMGTDQPRALLMAGNEQTSTKGDQSLQSNVSVLLKPFTAEELFAAASLALERPVPPTSRKTQKERRSASTPTVLAIGDDRDLLDWMATALRVRKVRCVCAASTEEALDASSKYNVSAVAVQAESPPDETSGLLQLARSIAVERGAPLSVLVTSSGEDENSEQNGYRTVRIPCSARELAEALLIGASVVA